MDIVKKLFSVIKDVFETVFGDVHRENVAKVKRFGAWIKHTFKRRLPIAVIIVLIFYIKDFVTDAATAMAILPKYFTLFIPMVFGMTVFLMILPALLLGFFGYIAILLGIGKPRDPDDDFYY